VKNHCKTNRFVSCSVETPVVDFGRQSFVEWDLKAGFYERLARTWHVTNLQLMFRTRRSSGLLFKAQNAQKSQYVVLEVRNTTCTFDYIHSFEKKILMHDASPASDVAADDDKRPNNNSMTY